jgi:hypothetical protein
MMSNRILTALILIAILMPLQPVAAQKIDIGMEMIDYSMPDSAITSYLETNLLPPVSKGNKVISVFKVVGESNKRDTTLIYLWEYTCAYSLERGVLKEGTTSNFPIILKAIVKPDHYRVLSLQQPESGDRYAASLQALFPAGILKRINQGSGNLRERSRNLAKEYYHLK